jgi:hypothetical protein
MKVISARLFSQARSFLAFFGIKMSFGPTARQVREVAKLLVPKPSPKPLIRIGGDTDGGYLLPDDLDGIGACFSPGVAETCTFELDLANRGIRSFLADFSVAAPPVSNPLFSFEKLYIGPETDGEMFISLPDWVESKNVEKSDLILQMDIEGAEWQVLEATPTNILQKFRIIVIELHNLDEMMSNMISIQRVEAIFKKLISGFIPVHLHPNNCCPSLRFRGVEIPSVLEVTFLRKDRYGIYIDRHPARIPHPLDMKNVPNRKAAHLTSDWTI